MNKNILNTDNQQFILNNFRTDISSLLLRKLVFKDVTLQELTEQIEAKKRCQNKLNTWCNTPNIYYPNKLNIEQTSSETTAVYKANLVSGKSLIDLTGGYGVDCFYFSKKIKKISHCEINPSLSEIVNHNYKQLKCSNIKTIIGDGIEYLKNTTGTFDWIYIDPSRRSDSKGKVFLLSDCLPNITDHIEFLFTKSKNILIKTSPLLDITNGLKELGPVKEIHIVAVKNEVKELLFLLEKNHSGNISIKTANIHNDTVDTFSFIKTNSALAQHGLPKKYLYEPNSAILKSGGFNEIALQHNLYKLHQHSHLYSNDVLIDFPGRSFEITEIIPYNKKELRKRFKKQQINVTTRNFPKSVAEIRQELQIKDGGTEYLFFTTNIKNKKIAILCFKKQSMISKY
ncbi:MAG: SAM-dependent methyltransferase [Kordia sp.]|nr:MAG: SAM-dependent methyltransferase [Kordia sp.]